MGVIEIPASAERVLDWIEASEAISDGHRLPKAQIRDVSIERGTDSLLSRTAWIDGMGSIIKTATVFPDNTDVPTVNGSVALFSDTDGTQTAAIDFALLTKWKTAADSLLAARRLGPSAVDSILIVGAGPMAVGLWAAYREFYPDALMSVISRTIDSAERFAASRPGVTVARDMAAAVRSADLITVATTATSPIIEGAWLRAGQHLDLVGAFRHGMREADDEVMRRGRVFVDSRDTVLEHIGEITEPIDRGVIGTEDVFADFYDLDTGRFERESDDEITVFKNGGGAHLDLMVANYMLERSQAASAEAPTATATATNRPVI